MPRDTDWEAIEREYRAGQLSVREIGRQHGITEGAIRKRATLSSWTRDLTARVQAAVRSGSVRNEVRAEDARTDQEIIDEAAARGVELVRQHRSDLRSGRQLVGRMMAELDEASEHRDDIEGAIRDETASDRNGERRAMMLRAVRLPSRAGVLKDLSAALKNLIPLERQAFNLDDTDGSDGGTLTVRVVRFTGGNQPAE